MYNYIKIKKGQREQALKGRRIMKDYEREMEKILNNAGVKVDIVYITKSFPKNWDNENLHDQYKILLTRGKKQMQFDFWASLHDTQENTKPTIYDVIACLEWYDIYDFESFCWDFGYDTDSRKALEIYLECEKQQKELFALIPEEEIKEKIRDII